MGGGEAAGPWCSTDTRTSPREATENKQQPWSARHAAKCLTRHDLLSASLQHAQTLRPILVPIPGEPQPHHTWSTNRETTLSRAARNANNHWLLQEGTSSSFVKFYFQSLMNKSQLGLDIFGSAPHSRDTFWLDWTYRYLYKITELVCVFLLFFSDGWSRP